MEYTVEQYKHLLKSLYPKGKAWNKETGSVLDQYCHALAEEFKRIDDRQKDLIVECHVSLATELLDEHEEDYNINNSDLTTQERRDALVVKLLTTGGLRPQYYIDLLTAAGYTATIEEYTPAWVGTAVVGDMVGDQYVLFMFTVYIDIDGDGGEISYEFDESFDRRQLNDITVFQSRVRSLFEVIELIHPIKPAHMRDYYQYLNAEFSSAFSWAYPCLPFNDDTIPIIQFNSGYDTSFAAAHEYDGEYLTGSYDGGFNLAFDAHFGGAFQSDQFATDYIRPV